MRKQGHKLKTEWNGRRGADAVTTGTCLCGKWTKTADSQEKVRAAYRTHVAGAAKRTAKKPATKK